jgi:hypothetical protein
VDSTTEQEAVATWPFRQTPLNSDLVERYRNSQVATASWSVLSGPSGSEVNGLSAGHTTPLVAVEPCEIGSAVPEDRTLQF